MTGLARFRVDEGSRPAPPPKVRQPITIRFEGTILAFDQSLSATGIALLRCHEGAVEGLWTGMIKTEPILKGNDDTLLRGEVIFAQARDHISTLHPRRIVHERPPTAHPGMKLKRTDASMVAAMAVRCAAGAEDVPIATRDIKVIKNRLTGDPNADKDKVRAAVIELIPRVASIRPANNNTYDAWAVALVAAEEE